MLLIPPRSHCVSNGAVTEKQGTKSIAAVSMGGCKRQFWWDIDWCDPHRVTGPGPPTRGPWTGPGHWDNGPRIGNPALTTDRCQLANTGHQNLPQYYTCPHPQALCGFEFGYGSFARHYVTLEGGKSPNWRFNFSWNLLYQILILFSSSKFGELHSLPSITSQHKW